MAEETRETPRQRIELIQAYKGSSTWKNKVMAMTPSQVFAVYSRLKKKNRVV